MLATSFFRLGCTLIFLVYAKALAPEPQLHHRKVIPYCTDVLKQLDHHTLVELRDAIQKLHYARRVDRSWTILASRNAEIKDHIGKKDEEGWRKAYSSNYTTEELNAKAKQAGDTYVEEENKVMGFINELQGKGVLTANVDLKKVSSCVMGRLNTQLHHGHPVVTFMLQYWKRPWIIEK